MGWSSNLTQDSVLGSKVTFTPDTIEEGAYTVSPFVAPQKGIYRFELMGSGGTACSAAGGRGGKTDGYLLLEKGQAVYIGAGGTCSAAFVADQNGERLVDIDRAAVLFVAGAGGGGGYSGNAYVDQQICTGGGNGGGISGMDAQEGGRGATQEAGGAGGGGKTDGTPSTNGAYGIGGAAGSDYEMEIGWARGGRGGDGFYGGGGGAADAVTNSQTGQTGMYGYGGGGGSGYVKDTTLNVFDRTYVSKTSHGEGAQSGENGSVRVTYYARAQLPIRFDGLSAERLFFNGTQIRGLVFNGVRLFVRRWMRCLQCQAGKFACRAATRG